MIVDVAHRGGAADAPENTLAAFRSARARGADMFELDVRLTRDDQLIVIHDATLTHTTDAARRFPNRAPWRVRDFTLAQIRCLDAGSWFSRRFSGERVPDLPSVMRVMRDSHMGMLLHVKTSQAPVGERIKAVLQSDRYWLTPGHLIVQSSDTQFLQGFHRLIPDVPTAILGTPSITALPHMLSYARFVNPPSPTVTAQYVQAVHQLGMRLYAWHVEDAPTMGRMIAAGIDGIITNHPTTLHQELSRTCPCPRPHPTAPAQ